MEWQQLEYFQTVAKLQHMTLAAQQLKITQPALSRSIARLENEMGVPLFDRQGRSIILNRYGRNLLRHVNNIFIEYETARSEIQNMIDPEVGEISLGFLHTLGVSYIPGLIQAFSSKYPKIKFLLHQNGTDALMDQLESGKIDLCFSYPSENDSGMEWTHLWSEELFIIVPVNHPLAKQQEIDLIQIANEPVVLFKKGYGLRKITDELFVQSQITPKITFEGEEVHTICGLVAAGLGVAIIPYINGMDQETIAQLHVKTPECKREIGIMKRKERYLSPAASMFLEFVIEHFIQSGNESSSEDVF